MTPSGNDHHRSKRGADNVDNVEKPHIQMINHVSSGDINSADSAGFVHPRKNKKRSRRRQRGKTQEATQSSLQATLQPNGTNSEISSHFNSPLQLPLQSLEDSKVAKPKKRRRKRTKAFSQTENQQTVAKNTTSSIHPSLGKTVAHEHCFTSRASHSALYAALDLGTNNCRLLIAAPTKPGYFRVVDAFSRIVRLGEDLGHSGVLSQAAMDRAIEALKVCAEKLEQRNLRGKRLIATEACRSAKNGDQFIKRVKQETGLDLEIIDRETEARLAVSGCSTLIEADTKAVVLFDIGGGSSEIALIDLSQKHSPRLADHITAWTSLPVGVVSLAEQFGGDIVGPDDFISMKNYVLKLLDGFSDRDKLGALAKGPGFHLLGTSGTVTTLAGLHLDLERYDRRRVDGIWLENAEVIKMTEKLLSWDLAHRIANPCIGRDRADLVLAGCAILEAIREIWPSERLRVADRGLREGILTELMAADGVWRRRYRRHRPSDKQDHQKVHS